GDSEVWELIVVEKATSDPESLVTFRELKQRDSRIRVLRAAASASRSECIQIGVSAAAYARVSAVSQAADVDRALSSKGTTSSNWTIAGTTAATASSKRTGSSSDTASATAQSE